MAVLTTPPARRTRRRVPWRALAGLVPALLVGAWTAGHWAVVADGGRDLLGAHPGWLLAALAATGLGWVANACARQGTVLEPLPPARLVATQFAATAAGQLAPAGIGASAVNLRFLRAHGVPLIRASAALALYSLAESASRVGLLLVLLAAFPHALHTPGVLPARSGLVLLAAIAVAGLTAAVVVLAAMERVRRAVRGFLTAALADLRSLHTRPSRVLALWGGSLAFPVLQAASMAAVALALDMPVPAVHVAIAYLAATCVAAAVPSPGGIGSVDAALGLALVAAGSPTATAASAVLGFRIVTVWLPLVPAVVALSALIRRKVL
ncbi:lysylphosphatidylglycerol synthase transmembrane domain-containing protein [Actinacidiphila acidipaludis]|uniref:lysylphosphatidylglycerol synthase transmembrane domain-containing protein n=1 Tax=Actinacidiphila acidipaludis TaxID=2873382 RepID=UPI0027E1A1A6|nr:lysylphosphatidylglycerol synthase domain-containing protein [Streptomyces acidipaludis]